MLRFQAGAGDDDRRRSPCPSSEWSCSQLPSFTLQLLLHPRELAKDAGKPTKGSRSTSLLLIRRLPFASSLTRGIHPEKLKTLIRIRLSNNANARHELVLLS
eukprot:763197-Hanusia_phi.AAC.2